MSWTASTATTLIWTDATQSNTTNRNASRFLGLHTLTANDIDFALEITSVNPFYLTSAPDAQNLVSSKNDPI